MHRCLRSGIAIFALLLSLLLGVSSGGAAPAGTVVASGLVNPRYLAVLDDGTIYVSEAGTGGSEALPPNPDAPPGSPPGSRGTTGRVTKIAPGGAKTVVATGLPSYNEMGAVGPAGIVYANGAIWLAISGGGVGLGITPLANENAVVKIDPTSGAVTRVADIGAYEKANNPAKNNLDANLYGMALGPDGNLIVADAAGDAVYRVNPASGIVGAPTIIPCIAPPTGLPLPPGGNPECPNSEPKIDSVPTSPAVGPDGTVYVGLLSGGPFIPGTAKVVKLGADGTVSDAVTGLTMVTGVAFGPDKAMYVCELSTEFSETGPPKPGQVLRVLPGGKTEVVVDNLLLPNGIAFDKAGNLYVTTNTVAFGPGAPAGTVTRYDGIAAAPAPSVAATPAPVPTATPVRTPTPPAPMPGLPNTGGGGGNGPTMPVWPLLALGTALGGALALRRRTRATRAR